MIYDLFSRPMPWYVAGPLIGLMVPALLITGNKMFGISSSFSHVCASVLPKKFPYFNYDWKAEGGWNLKLVLGITLGGILAAYFTPKDYEVAISPDAVSTLKSIGITDFKGLAPAQIFSWSGAGSLPGLLILVIGGFLIGFGTRYAEGCTSGHAITGMATLQRASLIAVIGFFIGGLISTYFILPYILS